MTTIRSGVITALEFRADRCPVITIDGKDYLWHDYAPPTWNFGDTVSFEAEEVKYGRPGATNINKEKK